MYIGDDDLNNEIKSREPFCSDYPDTRCLHCDDLGMLLDLRDARKEIAELRAWREQVFIAVRQIESARDELLRIMESLKK